MLRSIHSLSRWQAFGVHLLISAMVLIAILLPVFLLWYPDPYHRIVEIWNVLSVLILVDVVIGPLLTLVVFKPGKKSLAFDLGCIALLQIAALGYGTTMIYLSRPYFQVFAIDRFNVVSTRDVDMARLADPAMAAGYHFGPRLVYAEPATNAVERHQMLMQSLSGAPDLERRTDRYRPYQNHIDAVLARAKPLSELADDPAQAQMVADFLATHGGGVEDYRYLPLVGGGGDVAQVISAENAEPVDTLFIDPW